MFIIPVIGGYIADTLAGKYNTILGSGLIYVLGKFKWQNLKFTETVLQFTTVLAFIYTSGRALNVHMYVFTKSHFKIQELLV